MKKMLYILKCSFGALDNPKAKRAAAVLWILSLSFYLLGMVYPLSLGGLIDGTVELCEGEGAIPLPFVLGLIGVLFYSVYRTLYYSITGVFRDRVSHTVIMGIQGSIFRKISRIRYDRLNQSETYEKIQTVSEEFPSVCSNYVSGDCITSLIGTLVSFVFTTVVLFQISPVVALLMATGNVFGFFKTFLETKLNYYNLVGNMKERRIADAYFSPMVSREFIKEVRLFGLYGYLTKQWNRYLSSVHRKTLKLNLLFSLLDLLLYLINTSFVIVALWITAQLVIDGNSTPGSVLLVYTSCQSVLDRSSNLYNSIKTVRMSNKIVDLYREVADSPEVEPTRIESPQDSSDSTIVFDHVSFAYHPDQPVLKDINLTVKSGEKIAIVGENGSGKTTLISLLNGFYVPTKGNVRVGGEDSAESLSNIRSLCTTLFQDFGIYETTIADNVNMGVYPEQLNPDEMQRLTEKTGAFEFISSLSDGFDTSIGRFSENGIELSGGQWQKIALARCLANSKKKVIILDEPNASLDPISEAKIYENVLDTVERDKTLVLISHRFGACRYADTIYVLDQGTIVESGTHAQLIDLRGKYYELYNAQVQYYE